MTNTNREAAKEADVLSFTFSTTGKRPSTYKVSSDDFGNMLLVGPRGAVYDLVRSRQNDGVYIPYNIKNGTQLKSNGNPVLVIIVGDIACAKVSTYGESNAAK